MPLINLDKKEIDYIKENLISVILGDKIIKKEYLKVIKKLNKALKPIKRRSAKNKGLFLQKWVCKKISEITGIPYNQQDDDCLIHSREASQSGVDIILRGKAKKLFPFSIECKSSEQFNMFKAVEQAKSNRSENIEWLIVYKRKSFKKPVVIMDWVLFEDFIKIILRYEKEGK